MPTRKELAAVVLLVAVGVVLVHTHELWLDAVERVERWRTGELEGDSEDPASADTPLQAQSPAKCGGTLAEAPQAYGLDQAAAPAPVGEGLPRTFTHRPLPRARPAASAATPPDDRDDAHCMAAKLATEFDTGVVRGAEPSVIAALRAWHAAGPARPLAWHSASDLAALWPRDLPPRCSAGAVDGASRSLVDGESVGAADARGWAFDASGTARLDGASRAEPVLRAMAAQLTPRASLRMRFPPAGAHAVLQACNASHALVAMRAHVDFELGPGGSAPRLWFTPAALAGRALFRLVADAPPRLEAVFLSVPTALPYNVDVRVRLCLARCLGELFSASLTRGCALVVWCAVGMAKLRRVERRKR